MCALLVHFSMGSERDSLLQVRCCYDFVDDVSFGDHTRILTARSPAARSAHPREEPAAGGAAPGPLVVRGGGLPLGPSQELRAHQAPQLSQRQQQGPALTPKESCACTPPHEAHIRETTENMHSVLYSSGVPVLLPRRWIV